jgi:ABC-2 type transport system ATP-binding protein
VASGALGDIKAGIGQDVIEVAVADPARLEQVGQILVRVTSRPPRLDRSGQRARASTTEGASDLAAVIQGLSDAAIAVDEIGLRRPTLDEVFLAVTGAGTGAGAGAGTGAGTGAGK